MGNPVFRAFITKYALTNGIYEVEVEQCLDTQPNGSFVKETDNTKYTSCYHGEGKEWHRTKLDAVNRANDMRIKKIRSHQTAISKLQKMTFNP